MDSFRRCSMQRFCSCSSFLNSMMVFLSSDWVFSILAMVLLAPAKWSSPSEGAFCDDSLVWETMARLERRSGRSRQKLSCRKASTALPCLLLLLVRGSSRTRWNPYRLNRLVKDSNLVSPWYFRNRSLLRASMSLISNTCPSVLQERTSGWV